MYMYVYKCRYVQIRTRSIRQKVRIQPASTLIAGVRLVAGCAGRRGRRRPEEILRIHKACVGVCVCVRVCVHVCVYACMHVCVHACMCACVHACMCVCVYVCVCMRVCSRARVRLSHPRHAAKKRRVRSRSAVAGRLN